MNDLRDRYLACWNADDATRTDLVGELFAADARYVDPMGEATGQEAIATLIAGVRAQFPDLVLGPAGDLDAHHDVARFRWGLGPAGAAPVVVGFDVLVTDDEGRVSAVLGFLDQVPT